MIDEIGPPDLATLAILRPMRGEITVAEALALPALRRARLVAGKAGVHRAIRHVNVMEVPDILPFVKPSELLLTSGYPIKDEPRSLEELIARLAERGLAALAIAPHPYVGSIPEGAIASGDAHAFPIIELPDQASFNEIIAAVLEPILDRTREERHRAVLLDELVSGHPIDERELSSHAAALGWSLAGPRAVVVAELRDRGGHEALVAGRPLEARAFEAIGALLDARTIAWARRAGLALIADASDGTRPRALAGSVARSLAVALPDLVVTVGVGTVRARLSELTASYGEAVRALAIGRERGTAVAVMSFDELGLYRLLHAVGPAGELRRYCEDLLGPLITHDRAHGSDLVRTLEAYLRNERNVAATARELFVHYNTLRYRLGKIDEVLGGLDRTQTARLSIEVALHAARMLDATAPERS
jgi:DNA-binding PucR family transcriptional regulator